MKACPAREEALALLKKYNKEPFHIQHGLTVEGTMRWYANELGYGEDADFWATGCQLPAELLRPLHQEPE